MKTIFFLSTNVEPFLNRKLILDQKGINSKIDIRLN